MQVLVIRRGGLAGIPLHAVLDTTQLVVPAAARAEQALRDLPWDRPPPQPAGADRFQYELVVTEKDGARRVTLNESEIPDALRPLVQLLHDHGHFGSPPA